MVQLVLAERVAELLATLLQRVPAAVLTQHELSFRHADGFRIDNFVGRFFLQISVLMDAGFVRERVAADDGLIGLRSEGDDGAEKLAGGIEVLGVDAGLERELVVPGLERHHDFLERAVAGALPDAVDSALDLPGAGLDGGDGIRYCETQVVVAMYADYGAIAQDLDDVADQSAILGGRREADRIRNMDGPRAGGGHGLRNFLQETGLGAGAVFGRKLYIIDVAPRQLDGGDRLVEHLVLRLLELVP